MAPHRIARDAALSFVGQFLAQIIYAAAFIAAARRMGPEPFGVLNVALALSALLGFFADLGVTHTFIREATRPGANVRELLGQALTTRVVLSIVVTVLSAPLVLALYAYTEGRTAILVLSVLTIWGSSLQGLLGAYFVSRGEFSHFAMLSVAAYTFRAFALIGALALGTSVTTLCGLVGGTTFAFGLLCAVVVHRWSGGFRRPTSVIDEFGAFSIGGIATMVLPQIAPLALERVATLADVGAFSAAQKIPGYFYVCLVALGQAYYPRLFEAGHKDAAAHRRLCSQEIRVLAALGLIVAIPISAYANQVVGLIYGSSWAVLSGPLLTLLVWTTYTQALMLPFADALTTSGLQRRRALVFCATVAAALVLYPVMGSRWGGTGCAVAALLTSTLLTVALLLASVERRAYFLAFAGPNAAAAAAGLLAAHLLHHRVPWLVGCCLTGLAVAATVLALDSGLRWTLVGLLRPKLRGRGALPSGWKTE